MAHVEDLRRLAGYYRDLLANLSEQSGKHLVDLGSVLRHGLVADFSQFVPDLTAVVERDTFRIKLERMSPRAVAEILERSDQSEDGPGDADNDSSGLVDGDEAMDLNAHDVSTVGRGISQQAEVSRKREASANLQAIYRKQEQDPYNRETLLGFPLLVGKYGSRTFCAPLFYYVVTVDVDPVSAEAFVKKNFATPLFNSHVISKLVGAEGETELVRQKVLALLSEEEFTLSTVQKAVRALGELVTGLKGLTEDSRRSLPLTEVLPIRGRPGAWLVRSSVIVNASRSNAFLQDDLVELSRLPKVDGETVVATLLEDVPENLNDPEDNDGGGPGFGSHSRPLLFPLQSNQQQRRAARLAEHARLLVIQGPPGTGKSQTIANLVCDLVGQGKSVLVTSHQNKALEVIRDKLPDVDYLAMPLLKGDREATAQLINKLESFNSVVSGLTREGLHRSANELLSRISEHKRQAEALKARFSELKILERTRFPHYHRYHTLRHLDQIQPEDSIPPGAEGEVASALRQWLGYWTRAHSEAKRLDDLIGPGNPQPAELAKRAQQLHEMLGVFRRALELLGTGLVGETRQWLGDVDNPAIEHPFVVSYLGYLQEAGPRLVRSVSRMRELMHTSVDLGELRRIASARNSSVIVEMSARAATIHEEADKLLWAATPLCDLPEYPSSQLLLRLGQPLRTLSQCCASWIRWHMSPSARAARRSLEEAGVSQVAFASACTVLSAYGAWHDYWSRYQEVQQGINQLRGADIPVPMPKGTATAAELVRLSAIAREATQVIALLHTRPSTPAATLQHHCDSLLETLVSGEELGRSIALLEFRIKHLGLLMDMAQLRGNPFLKVLLDSTLPSLKAMVETLTADASAFETFERLQRTLLHAEAYVRAKELEAGPLRTLTRSLEALKAAIESGGDVGWVSRAEEAIEAFRLSSFIRDDLVKNPDHIGQVADGISKHEAEARNLTVRLLRQLRLLGLKTAELDNPTKQQIVRLRQILRRKRKTASLVQLRERIDYTRLLQVLPCWIVGIEDVARIFPLQAGLFDYLIVDEASQCNQATSLHLAYRAKRMIVVGDRQQLKNANARWLKDDLVQLLLARHSLDIHPKAPFLHGRMPLLELAEASSNRQEFLNEHFRCEPPIISWSNAQFYDNRLRILTPVRAKSFRPALEVRLVSGAAEDTDKKQNEVEARAVVQEARRLIESGEAEGLTIGILSPFAHQAHLLQSLMYEIFDDHPEWIKTHQLTVSTADGFQGDERDIMLYSMSFGPNSPPGRITAIELEPERLNVAFTRARRKATCFVSIPVNQFPGRYIRGFLEHAEGHQRNPEDRLRSFPEDQFDSLFEQDVVSALRARGLTVYTQVPCAGFRIDLVVRDNEGRRIAVECDGDFHYDEDGELRPEDYLRQDIIERNGWFVHRIPARHYYRNPEAAIAQLLEDLSRQPTEEHVLASESSAVIGLAERKEPLDWELEIAEVDGTEGKDDLDQAPASSSSVKAPQLGGQTDLLGQIPNPEPLGPGDISRPAMWYRLSHWGKVTGRFTGYNNRFCYQLGRLLAKQIPLSDSQRRYAMRLWNAALSQGFNPADDC